MSGLRSHSVTVPVFATAGTGAGLALLAFRDVRSGYATYDFLAWNLFLAWIPYALALLTRAGHRLGAPWYALVAAGTAWLLFLPNAPYMVTDFVHLGRIYGMPVWFDAAMIGSFAATGLLLGFASLHVMQSLARGLGAGAAWLLTLGALALSGVGIYLGRVLQFNSWDAIVRPGRLVAGTLATVTDPGSHTRALAAAAVLGTLLVLGYLPVHWLSLRGAGTARSAGQSAGASGAR